MSALIAIRVDNNEVISDGSDMKPNLSNAKKYLKIVKNQKFGANLLSSDASSVLIINLNLNIKFTIVLLAIVEAFKTWRPYLVGCKHKVFVFIDYNNLCRFINTKSLSSCQAQWGQDLLWYHFWIDYCLGKTNGVTDALFCFPQRN